MTAAVAQRADTWLRSVRRRIRGANYLRKWVVLSALIGVVGGLGAIAFYTALELATQFFLGFLGGYTPPSPAGEGAAPITGFARAWALPLVVALGGLISGIIVYRFAPEAEGHGTDAAIAAFHHHPRGIRGRIPLVKLVASAVTIGSRGDLRLLPGDHLSIFATPAARPQVDDLVDTPGARADHGVADAPATAVGAPEG